MLNCGKSEALDSITGKVDEIKAKLAEGMSALGDLEAKAQEALGELNAALPELPDVTSLQADLNAALSAAQSDFAAALNDFNETWGDKLSSSEIDEYFATISEIASNPLALLDFDPCEAFPNKELDEDGNVVVKPKVAKAPEAKPVKTKSFEEITTSIAAKVNALGIEVPAVESTGATQIDLSSLPSVFSPAGTSLGGSGFSGAMKTRQKVLKTVNDHYMPDIRKLRIAYEELKKNPAFKQTGGEGFNGQAAVKRHNLYQKGKMTQAQVTWYEEFRDAELAYQLRQDTRDLVKDQLLVYIEFLAGRVTQQNLDKGEAEFKSRTDLLLSDDIELYEAQKKELDKGKADFQGVGQHTNQVVSSVQ